MRAGLADLSQLIPCGGGKPMFRQLLGDESARFGQPSDQILIGHRNLITTPHGHYTSPNQHPKIAAGMVKRFMQVGQCGCQGQLSAAKRGEADHIEAFGGSRRK